MKKVILVILGFFALLAAYPVLFLAAGSLMGKQELAGYLAPVLAKGGGYAAFRLFPMYPTLRAYVELLLDSPGYFIMFWNSVRITAGILLGQLLAGVPAAWGFARFEFPFKRAVFTVYVTLMMMPFQVTMLSNYLVLDQMGLMDTLWAVILPGAFSTFPVFIMYRFFTGIPEAVVESARIDGAGEWKIFLHLGLPLGSGGICSAMVLGFLECWNLIEQPLTFLKNKELWPLSLYLPDIEDEYGVRERLLRLAEENGIEVVYVRRTVECPLGGAVLSLYPPVGEGDLNEQGLTALCSAGDFDVLITGDMAGSTERKLVGQYDLPDIEVLVVGHHGSRYSSSQELLQAVRPETAIISVGDNSYGHPTQEAMDRLSQAGAEIYRTDRQGNILVTVHGGD